MSRAIFEGLSNFGSGIAQGMIGRQQLDREEERRNTLGGLLDQENPDILEIAQYSPEIANLMYKQQGYQDQQALLTEQKDLATLGNLSVVASKMQDPIQIRSFLKAQMANGGHSDGVMAELADTLNMDDEQMLNDIRLGAQMVSEYETASQREWSTLTDGLSTEDAEKARRIKLGLDPRASTSADERIASDQELTNAVADSKAAIAGKESAAKEKGKLEEQLELMPKVRAAIKEAETAAQDKGETTGAYKRAKAALPGLMEVSNRLKALADVATYTMAGKAWDGLVKQLGFGETEGSTARATMESIVDNQVLPLLRDTFGAAFTAAEGERLRNTLLDPDNAPEAKKASLDAFLEQKMRNLEAQERELGVEPQQSLSIDDLVTKYAN